MAEAVSDLIRLAAKKFSSRGIETAGLDARLLLQAAAGLSHADIVAEPGLILPAEVVVRFWSLIERRLALEPVARILGAREFYGRNFRVTPAVLDPRADTETLIDAALGWAKDKGRLRILDLGTGSGAIAVTLLAEMPEASAIATDLSGAALEVAASNAEALGVAERIRFLHANWFDGVEGQFDLIVSNPPYIPLGDITGLSADVRDFDPVRALDGGPDGLEPYRRIAKGAGGHLMPRGHVIVEIGAGQEGVVKELFKDHGFNHESRHLDLAGHARCLAFRQS